MPNDPQREQESTTLKSYLSSGLYALIGLLGLAAADFLTHKLSHQPWWLPAVQNGFAIIAGTGFIGILLELSLRRTLLSETVVRLKTLFNEDPEFANSLSASEKERRVENTLKAHLGSELGHAIFLGLVHRYFVHSTKYRKDARFVVTLSSCTNLKVNTFIAGSPLRTEDYCNLLADYSFRVKFAHAGTLSVICTLSHDMADLYDTFRRPDCIAREVIQLETADRASIVETFKAITSEDERSSLVQSIARVELLLNGSKLPATSARFIESSLSLVFEFDASGRKDNPDPDKYQILIRSIFLRSCGVFPVVIADPTYNPCLEFSYPDPKITRVFSSPFITSDAPFEPHATNDLEARKISIDTLSATGEPGWVFPSSAVIFTWKSV